jgi:hypothetical protein
MGVNLAFFSGNDFTWQVRLEKGPTGAQTKMVAYKLAAYPDTGRCGTCWEWGGDPEFQAAYRAKLAGDLAAHTEHLRNVTYAWAGLKDWDPNAPSANFGGDHKGATVKADPPVARFAIALEGLMNGPKLPYCPKNAPSYHVCNGLRWIIDNDGHWVFTGEGVPNGVRSGLQNGDSIPQIVGYEMDNARLGKDYPMRPRTQVILGYTDATFTPENGSAVDFTGLFNAQYYQHTNGAHVFAGGLINWFWGVERDGLGAWGGVKLSNEVKPGLTVDKAMTAVTLNVLRQLQEGPGTPPVIDDPNGNNVSDGGSDTTAGVEQRGATGGSGGCAFGGAGVAGSGIAIAGGLTAVAAWGRRQRRRSRSAR